MDLYFPDDSLIGDTVLAEPAMAAYYRRTGKPVFLCLPPRLKIFYRDNPAVFLHDEKIGKQLSCGDAFGYAVHHRKPFASGYFPQLGMEPNPGERLHYRYFGYLALPDHKEQCLVVLAPFSRSCSVHTNGVANKTPNRVWVEELVLRCLQSGKRVISLGSATDPAIPSTENWRGRGWEEVLGLLHTASVVVSVDTGIVHLAAAVARRVVFLNSALPAFMCQPPDSVDTVVVQGLRPENWDLGVVMQGIESLCAKAQAEKGC